MKHLFVCRPYVLLTLILLFFFQVSYSQKKPLPKSIQLASGYSLHGSGDLHGMFLEFGYKKFYTPRFSLKYNIRTTIHDGKDEYIINNLISGQRIDASVRYTTAGVQAGVDAGYSPIRTKRSDLTISIGAFGRYQSASNGTDGYELYMPSRTGQPTILIGYDNKSPQRTVSVGGSLMLSYQLLVKNKVAIGPIAGFQTDTNGDFIAMGGLNAAFPL